MDQMTTYAAGIFLPTMSERGTMPGDVAAAARHAEELGFESVWVIDQLVAGTGVPLLDSGIALATAAAATSRVGLGYGVLVVPLHPLVSLAKQGASLPHGSRRGPPPAGSVSPATPASRSRPVKPRTHPGSPPPGGARGSRCGLPPPPRRASS